MAINDIPTRTFRDYVASLPSGEASAFIGDNLVRATPGAGQFIPESDRGDFATAQQGQLASTALQPGSVTRTSLGIDNVDNTSDAEKASSGPIASAIAAKVNTSDLPYVTLEQYGAVAYTRDQLVALAGNVDAQATLNSQALSDATNAVLSMGGGRVFAKAGIYVFNQPYVRPAGVFVEGLTPGRFQPLSVADKDWTRGTTFLFKGNPSKTVTFSGITSMEHGGGWRPDPDNPGQTIKLWSAYNSDASGTQPATLRQFSVAILENQRLGFGGVKGCRIAVWKGVDGISDYSNASSGLWGDDWDFGHVILNMEQCDDERLQIVGPWREAGHAMIITLAADNRCERNSIRSSIAQGRIGHLVRAPDMWAVTGLTTNTISIRWSSEIYFSPSGGSFRGSDNVTYTYTGVQHVGTDPVYTFTGVTPDPQAAGIFHIRHASSGLANSEYSDFMAFGLDHPSGNRAEFYATTSKAREISGNPLRGLKFRNSKNHTRERVISDTHISADLTEVDHQFEGGGLVLASPATTAQSYAAAPVGDTRNYISIASVGLSDAADLRLFLPRSGYVEELQLNPRADTSGDTLLKAFLSGRNLVFQSGTSAQIQLKANDGTLNARFPDAGGFTLERGGQITLTGGVGRLNFQTGQAFTLREGTTVVFQVDPTTRNIRPGVSGSQNFGAANLYWGDGFFKNVHMFPPMSASPTVNGELLFELTSNTKITVKVRGSDGTTRSTILTLA